MKNTPRLPRFEAHELRSVAVASSTDPRSVARVIAGKSVRPLTRARIVAALRARGFALPGDSPSTDRGTR